MKQIIAIITLLLGTLSAMAQMSTIPTPPAEGVVNAHGGCIIRVDSLYYWYGENRPYQGFTTEVGVSVYTSHDLQHWQDGGVALSVSEEAGSPIERGCIMERPKVVYCPKTGKYVLLFHLELKGRGYEAAQVGFAESDTPTGPFRFIRALRPNADKWPKDFTKKDIKKALEQRPDDYKDWWTPEWRTAIKKGMFVARDLKGGQMSRDMTVYVDQDGTAYHITSSEDNLTIHINELTPDFLSFTGRYVRVAPGGQNEAPTIFRHNGTYWMICSGCTGWAPNAARLFSAKSIWGPWKQHPNPCRGDGADKTFGGQGTYILTLSPVEAARLEISDSPYPTHIFMADIWTPKHLSHSGHLWVPITFENGMPVLRF